MDTLNIPTPLTDAALLQAKNVVVLSAVHYEPGELSEFVREIERDRYKLIMILSEILTMFGTSPEAIFCGDVNSPLIIQARVDLEAMIAKYSA